MEYTRIHACSKVPDDFLNFVVEGVSHLKKSGRSNVIYLFAKALGTMRSDGSDTLLPAKRMPMGLIEHTVNFLTVDAINKVCLHMCTECEQVCVCVCVCICMCMTVCYSMC